MAMVKGPFSCPLARQLRVAYGQGQWPLALANGHWSSRPMASGHGPWPRPRTKAKAKAMTMAKADAVAMAIGRGHGHGQGNWP